MSDTFLPPQCKYTVDGDIIVTDNTVHHKVSGTSMAGILECSPWSTPFQVACNLLGLCRKDISSKPAVIAGQMLEVPIINYLQDVEPDKLWMTAEEVYEKREGDHDSWESDFQDSTFAGHVDGIVMEEDDTQCILEIKTSSNMESWLNGVPKYYYWQVALYNEFLTQQDHAWVAMGMMTPESLRRPESWVPCKDNVVLYRMDIDRAEVQETLVKVKEWYETYILNGVTPPFNPENKGDVEMFEYLCNLDSGDGQKMSAIDSLMEVEETIAAAEAEIKELYDARDELRKELKDYMVGNDMELLNSASGAYRAVISKSVSRKIDPVLLAQDNINPEKYYKETVSTRFTVKAVKKE